MITKNAPCVTPSTPKTDIPAPPPPPATPQGIEAFTTTGATGTTGTTGQLSIKDGKIINNINRLSIIKTLLPEGRIRF
jgi:hypothetical protein